MAAMDDEHAYDSTSGNGNGNGNGKVPATHVGADGLPLSVTAAQPQVTVVEAWMQQVFARAHTGMCITTLEGRFVKVNQALCDMLDTVEPELLTKHFRDVLHHSDVLRTSRMFSQPGRVGRRRAVQDRFERRVVRPDGGVRNVVIASMPIEDDAGRAVCYFLQVADVTESRRVERELRHQTALYESLLEGLNQLGDGLVLAESGVLQYVNEAFSQIVERPKERLVGRRFPYDVVAPDRRDELREAVRSIRRGDVNEVALRTVLERHGQSVEVEAHMRTVVRDNRRTTVFAFRDITRQLREQRAVAELAAIVASSRDGIISYDLDGTVRTWNSGAEAISGWAAHEIVGRHRSVLVPESARAETALNVDRVLRGEAVQAVETQRVHRDGHLIDLSLSYAPIYGADGAVSGISVVARDVTEQRRAMAARDQLAAIVQSSPDAMWSMTTDGVVRTWNPGAERMLGIAPDDVVGRDARMLVPAQHLQAFESALAHVITTASPYEFETEQAGSGGMLVAVSTTWAPIVGEHQHVRGIAVVARDIADRKRAELMLAAYARQLEDANRALQEADRIKSDFVAMASHELRTPLTSIAGFTSTMIELWDQLSEREIKSFLNVIDEQSTRLSRLVNDLLLVSRIESGKLSRSPQRVNVREAVETVVRQQRAEGEVRVEVSGETHVLCDPDHLEQILGNYLANARKYGTAPITVCAATLPIGVELRVCDLGGGVPEQFRAHLFQRFSQASAGTTRQAEGSGLGLAIVKGLAQSEGGEAWYEPNTPTGACFCVRLPAA